MVLDQIPADSEEFIDDANLSFAYYYRVKAIVGDTSSTYSNEAFYEPLSSDISFLNKNTVAIFPNPTDGISSIIIKNEIIGKMKLSVFNILGQEIITEKTIDKNNQELNEIINLSAYKNGIYLIKIKLGGEQKLFRISKT